MKYYLQLNYLLIISALSSLSLCGEELLSDGKPDLDAGSPMEQLGGVSITKPRKWTSKNGKIIEARFIKFVDKETILLATSKAGFNVKIESLSEAEQKLLKLVAGNGKTTKLSVEEILKRNDVRISPALYDHLMGVFRKSSEKRAEVDQRVEEDQIIWEAWKYKFLAKQTSDKDVALKTAIIERVNAPANLNEFEKARYFDKMYKVVSDKEVVVPTLNVKFFSPLGTLGKYNFEENSYFFYFSPPQYTHHCVKPKDQLKWPYFSEFSRLVVIHEGQRLKRSAVGQINSHRFPYQLKLDPQRAEKIKNINDPLFVLFEGKLDKVHLTGGFSKGLPNHEFAYEIQAISLWYWSKKDTAFVLLTKSDPKVFIRELARGPIGSVKQLKIE